MTSYYGATNWRQHDDNEESEENTECPEYSCGIEMSKTELMAHLQWDHNRTEVQAREMLSEHRNS